MVMISLAHAKCQLLSNQLCPDIRDRLPSLPITTPSPSLASSGIQGPKITQRNRLHMLCKIQFRASCNNHTSTSLWLWLSFNCPSLLLYPSPFLLLQATSSASITTGSGLARSYSMVSYTHQHPSFCVPPRHLQCSPGPHGCL